MLESLDPRTLSLSASLAGFVLALVLWDAQRSGDRIVATGIWGVAALCSALGFGLNVFQDFGPDWLSRLAANTILALSVVLSWSGVRRFRKPLPPRQLETIIAVMVTLSIMVWNIVFLYVWPSARMRVIGISFVGGLFAALASWQFFKIHERHLRTGAWVAGVPLALTAIALLTRAVETIFSDEIRSAYTVSATNVVAYLSIVLSVLANSAGALMIVNAVRSERLSAMAYVDVLTGALSRRGLYRSLPGWFAKRRLDNAWLCVLDVDRFKQFNDAFGHEAGDVILKTVVSACRKAMSKDCVLARMGGDEFAVICATEIDIEAVRFAINTALISASKGVSPLAPPTIVPSQRSKQPSTPRTGSAPTIAIGSAPLLAGDAVSLAEALREADRKMYNGKIRQRDLGVITHADTRRPE
jgi:diguanylate cyclase (GGDEF)-like protein